MGIQNVVPTGQFWDIALSVLNARKRLGYFPKIKTPHTFNEYVLAQKYRFEGDITLARRLSDKYEVKSWLADIGLAELAVPTVGVFSSTDEIDAFAFEGDIIAKSCHGSGSTIIRTARNGHAFSTQDLGIFQHWLKEDYYVRSREPNYRGLLRRIIVEPLLRDETGEPPKDYKIFCTFGKPYIIQIDHDRYTDHTRQLYTPEWKLLDYAMCYPRKPEPISPPSLLETALKTASRLSQGFGCVRVDFYLMSDGPRLGEMTFFPGNGAELFTPETGDRALGKLLEQARS